MKKAILLLLASGAISQVQAAQIYEYTGNYYTTGYNVPQSGNSATSVQDPAKYGDRLTAKITLDYDIGRSFTGFLTSYDSPVGDTHHISSWTLYSGSFSLSNTDSSPYSFVHVFFNDGSITGWGLVAYSYDRSTLNLGSQSGQYPFDFIDYSNGDYQNVIRSNPGTWAEVSPVPLPGSALLFWAGLAVIGFVRIKQRRLS